jgi:signal recognition particle receptor subunit beta
MNEDEAIRSAKDEQRQDDPSRTETIEEAPPQKSKGPDALLLWQTQVRETLTPHLPPPVTRLIAKQLDPRLEPYVGPEATVTLVATLAAAWTILVLLRFLVNRLVGRKGRAIADEDDDHVLSTSTSPAGEEHADAQVVLCGPINAGKTRLFYELCYQSGNMPTLMSLKANVGLWTSADGDGTTAVRYTDWPGHASLQDPAFRSLLLLRSEPPRIVLVLDATQPVSAAADALYELLRYAALTRQKTTAATTIFVACHKSDLPKAKNHKRIKIQMRTELERLLKLRKDAEERDAAAWWPATGEPLELDRLSCCTLHFSSTTCVGKDCTELLEFCRTGRLPAAADR